MAGGEFALVMGPFAFQAELISSWANGANGQRDVNHYGAYAQASYFLTGENRVYDPTNGEFKRTRPKEPFALSSGAAGAWELAGRYSHLDLGHGNGGVQNNFSAGINWYLYSNLRFMVNYV